MDADEARRMKNDLTHGEDWARETAANMSFEKLLAYIHTPNSNTLEVAIKDELRKRFRLGNELISEFNKTGDW